MRGGLSGAVHVLAVVVLVCGLAGCATRTRLPECQGPPVPINVAGASEVGRGG